MQRLTRRKMLAGISVIALAIGCTDGVDRDLVGLKVKSGNRVATYDVIDGM